MAVGSSSVARRACGAPRRKPALRSATSLVCRGGGFPRELGRHRAVELVEPRRLDRLAPDLDVGCMLDGLLAREFIVPEERSTISGDRAFRFKHVLIRDVAYSGMSKAQRAEQHQVFAQWVDERAHDEFAEIRAHHLDEAAQLLNELDGTVPAELAREAAAARRRGGSPRPSPRARSSSLAACSCARPSWSRPPRGATSRRTRRGASRTSLRFATRPRARSPTHARTACARRGRALVLLAELALHADSDVARAHDLADEALAILPLDELAGL